MSPPLLAGRTDFYGNHRGVALLGMSLKTSYADRADQEIIAYQEFIPKEGVTICHNRKFHIKRKIMNDIVFGLTDDETMKLI